jgi:outer membrane protein assembly factor BamA
MMKLAKAGIAKWAAVSVLTMWIVFSGRAGAQYVLEDNHDPHRYDANTINVPLAYYSDAWRLSGGFATYVDGLGSQRQADAYSFLIGSSNGSYGAIVGMDDIEIFPVDRLFLGWTLSYIRTEEDTNNVGGNPHFPHETAGANLSGEKNYIASASNDFTGSFTFKYLLPIGDGRDRIIDHYRLNNGLLESGGSGGDEFWNPAGSGRTFLELDPRFEYMQIRSPYSQVHQADTNVFQFNFVYDNSDFPLTPSRGNLTTLSVARDFGLAGSSGPWTNLSAQFSEYVPLGQSNVFRQEVLALTGWTSYTPSWSQDGTPGHLSLHGAPPFYDGAELGGSQRMRGFPEERFHDRAGVYGCAELRVIPYWNPLGNIPALKSSDIAWMQFVTFIEVGRVADEYTVGKLFSHMKGDAGVGMRILTGDTVLRLDVAGSNEGIQFWANLNQAF